MWENRDYIVQGFQATQEYKSFLPTEESQTLIFHKGNNKKSIKKAKK